MIAKGHSDSISGIPGDIERIKALIKEKHAEALALEEVKATKAKSLVEELIAKGFEREKELDERARLVVQRSLDATNQ